MPAYRDGDQLAVWCEHERRWHRHGGTNGHRVAHCACPASPYHASGYELDEVGPMTAEVRAAHPDHRGPCPTCGAAR